MESCFAFPLASARPPLAPHAQVVFNDFLSCFHLPPSPLSPLLSFGPAQGGRYHSSDTPAKEATDYCPGSLSCCLVPGLSDRKVGVMLGKGKPHVLTLPWNLYYTEMQQLSPKGVFGKVCPGKCRVCVARDSPEMGKSVKSHGNH